MTRIWRIPVEAAYVAALGRAAYNFAYLEWGIVWLCETLGRGFLGRVSGLTAGQIARAFEANVNGVPVADADKEQLATLAADFVYLVDRRNALLHGTPHTAAGGEQRLLYDGKAGRFDWTIEEIEAAAAAFEEASIRASALLHGGRLEAYQSATGVRATVD